jgi:hypothetical protein
VSKSPDKEPGKKPSWWTRLREELAKPPSTGRTIAIGLMVIFAAGVVGSGAGYLLSGVGAATREVPFYAFVGGGAGLAVGLLSAWLGTRLYYRLLERTRRLEFDALQQRVARLGLARENLHRLDLYSDHIYGILEAFVTAELSLHDPSSTDAARAVCDVPAQYIHEATGDHVALSIWVEPTGDSEGILGRAAGFVRENVPDKVADPVKSALPGAKFDIVAGATTQERKAFTVRIASSWLKHHQLKEDDEPSPNDDPVPGDDDEVPRRSKDLDRFVYRADAPFDGLSDRDIKAFRELKYHAVRAISFKRGDTIYYVVALCKADKVFTEAEDLYLLWLKRVLELDRVMRSHNHQFARQAQQSDDNGEDN